MKSKYRITISDAAEQALAGLLREQDLATANGVIRRATEIGLEVLALKGGVSADIDLTVLGPWASKERVELLLAQAPGVFDALAQTLHPEWFKSRERA